MTPIEIARADAIASLDSVFGIGRADAHEILRTNAGAKRIYDCAVEALAARLAERRPSLLGNSLSGENTRLVQEVLHPRGHLTGEMDLDDLAALLDAARGEGDARANWNDRAIVKALLDTLPPVWTDEKAKALKDAQAFVDGVAAPVGVHTQRDASEFIATWFEGAQKWVVLFPDGTVLDDGFGAIGYAANAAYDHTGLGESGFDVTEDTGTFYRYERSES